MLAKDGPLVVETGKHTGRSAKDKFIVRDAETESTIWWDNNKSISPEHFAGAEGGLPRRAGREGGRCSSPTSTAARSPSTASASASSTSSPGTTSSSAPCWCAPSGELPASSPNSRSSTCRASAPIPRATAAARDGDRGQPHREDDPDRRHRLCRRDEEVGVRPPQLSAARQGRDADALLGQYRPERRHRRLLRPFRHRQDDALRRRQPHPDRRRRAWLVRHRRLQLRRRLLRQDDPLSSRGGAGNLRHHQALRHGARECRDRSGHARARPRRQQPRRE
jgi:hypothetical protein